MINEEHDYAIPLEILQMIAHCFASFQKEELTEQGGITIHGNDTQLRVSAAGHLDIIKKMNQDSAIRYRYRRVKNKESCRTKS